MNEIQNNDSFVVSSGRIRNEGGGKKNYEFKFQAIDYSFLDVIKDITAIDAMDDTVNWTHVKPSEIVHHLFKKTWLKSKPRCCSDNP